MIHSQTISIPFTTMAQLFLLSLLSLTSFVAIGHGFVATETWDFGQADARIHFANADVQPHPIAYPGKVDLSAELQVTRSVPADDLWVRLALHKTSPKPMLVPCFQNLGSCSYDVCNQVIPQNRDAFCAMGMCQCPFKVGKYVGHRIPYTLPRLGGPIFARLLGGSYTGNITFYNRATQQVYGCVGMRFTIENNINNGK